MAKVKCWCTALKIETKTWVTVGKGTRREMTHSAHACSSSYDSVVKAVVRARGRA